MKKWQKYCAGLATLASLTPGVRAQAPAIPAAAVAPAAAPAAAPTTLWSFLGLAGPQKDACKAKFCDSQFGALVNNGMAPLKMLSGGVIPSCCPEKILNKDEIAELAKKDPAAAAVAAIKADEAGAKARRANARFLGTVDCAVWPDAKKALIALMRTDKNECVRWEAAMAFRSGCCCKKDVIEALVVVVSGSTSDGNPAERCEMVKAAAEGSLYHCLNCYSEAVPEAKKEEIEKKREGAPGKASENKAPEKLPNQVGMTEGDDLKMAAFYEMVNSKTSAEVVTEAREALAQYSKTYSGNAGLPPGSHSVWGIFKNAMVSAPHSAETVAEGDAAHTAAPPEAKPVIHAMAAPTSKMPENRSTNGYSQLPTLTQPSSMRSMPASATTMRSTVPSTQVESQYQSRAPIAIPSYQPQTVASAAYQGQATSTPIYSSSSVSHATTAAPAVTMQSSRTQLPDVYQLMTVLRDATNPFQREWAAQTLAQVDWQAHPEVVNILVNSAKKDSAATVRVQCIRTLAKRNVNTMPVVSAIQELKADADPRVQHEANVAVARFGG